MPMIKLSFFPCGLIARVARIWWTTFLRAQGTIVGYVINLSGRNLSSVKENLSLVHNIPQCTELPILGVTFQGNCKYTVHIWSNLVKANKCFFILRLF